MADLDPPLRTSALLLAVVEGETDGDIGIGEIVHILRNRAFGLSMLMFALPCCLPMPPGIPFACGVGIAVVAVHLLARRDELWLPAIVARRTIARRDLRRMTERVLPYVRWLERICRPRLTHVTEGAGKQLIGFVVLVLAVLLILPIPLLGNLPPGFATAVIATGMSERDGLIVLAGLLVSAAAIALTSAMAWAAVEGLSRLL